jgi:ATP-dependent RNA helicase RhlE
MARAIDNQKKKDDPNFQGAFHEKKKRPGSDKPKRSFSGNSKFEKSSKNKSKNWKKR